MGNRETYEMGSKSDRTGRGVSYTGGDKAELHDDFAESR